MGFKGIDIRQSGDRILFRASLKDASGVKVTTGTSSLSIYELQSDGTLKSYDFNDNTFKTTALTTATVAMTHRTGNNATVNTGIWTYALTTISGFTRGNIYLAQVSNTNASPSEQEREFQYGDGAGDLVVDSNGLVDIGPASLQTLAREIWDASNVYFCRTDGSNTNAGDNPTTSRAFQTITKGTQIATSAGDTVVIAPGTFAESTNFRARASTRLVGSGMDTTTATSASSNDHICRWSSNATIQDITIYANLTPAGGTFQFPTGDATQTCTDVILRRVRTRGDTDGIYVAGSGTTFKGFDLELNSAWDTVFMGAGAVNCVGEIRTSTLRTIGPNAASPNSNSTIQVSDSNVLRVLDSKIINRATNSNSSRVTELVATRNPSAFGARIEFYRCQFEVDVPDGAIWYFSIAAGTTIFLEDCTYDQNKILLWLKLSGTSLGGTFTLSVTAQGTTQATTAIPYGSSQATVRGALEALSNVGVGNVALGGSGSNDYSFNFAASLGSMTIAVDGTGLTGTSPAARVGNLIVQNTPLAAGSIQPSTFVPASYPITILATTNPAVLAANGLDNISMVAPTLGNGWNFRQMMLMVGRRLFKRTTQSSNQLLCYADDGSTVISTQALTDSGVLLEQGASS